MKKNNLLFLLLLTINLATIVSCKEEDPVIKIEKDTQNVKVYDTIYISEVDSHNIKVYDTSFVTVYDTIYISPDDEISKKMFSHQLYRFMKSKNDNYQLYEAIIMDKNPNLDSLKIAIETFSDVNIILNLENCTELEQIKHFLSKENYNIKSIKLPNSLKTIGAYSFSNWYGLTEVDIPDGVTTIENGAFSMNMKSNWVNNLVRYEHISNLSSINIPKSVSSIGDNAFYGTSIKNINIPDNVTTIGNGAFAYTKINSITIPKSVTSMSLYFSGCENLKTVVHSLKECTGLEFRNCVSLESIILPDGVTTIPREAFYNCKSLPKLDLPESVETIGDSAFVNCEKLTTFLITKNVNQIYGDAFVGCKSIKLVIDKNNSNYMSEDNILFNFDKTTLISFCNRTIKEYIVPEGVTTIAHGAFIGLDNLYSITLPESLSTIDYCGFSGDNNLSTMTFKSTTPPDGLYGISDYNYYGGRIPIKQINVPTAAVDTYKNIFYYSNIIVVGY